jgi:hypothetical protein
VDQVSNSGTSAHHTISFFSRLDRHARCWAE